MSVCPKTFCLVLRSLCFSHPCLALNFFFFCSYRLWSLFPIFLLLPWFLVPLWLFYFRNSLYVTQINKGYSNWPSSFSHFPLPKSALPCHNYYLSNKEILSYHLLTTDLQGHLIIHRIKSKESKRPCHLHSSPPSNWPSDLPYQLPTGIVLAAFPLFSACQSHPSIFCLLRFSYKGEDDYIYSIGLFWQ